MDFSVEPLTLHSEILCDFLHREKSVNDFLYFVFAEIRLYLLGLHDAENARARWQRSINTTLSQRCVDMCHATHYT